MTTTATNPTKFRSLLIGDKFDFTASQYPSFFDRCIKTGARSYQSLETLTQYKVGSINVVVNDLKEHDPSADFV